MPSKIDIRLVFEALHDKMGAIGEKQQRLTEGDFSRLVKGAGIASSKNAIETLWFQLQDSEVNMYKGRMNIAVVDLARLTAVLSPVAHTHTHSHTLTHTNVEAD